MSKAVHWKIPFQSVKGINYEIRIYDEGYTGNAVTLQAGETPITTQEDASDDFFTPVRPSTGTISVIDPDGTLMEQLIPANNISRPVRLVSIDRTTTPATETIEWQGFLSCEAYQQDYTAIAQELQLSIISVLEAMDSVKITYSDFKTLVDDGSISTTTGIYTIKRILQAAIRKIDTSLYDQYIYFPQSNYDILNKYIDPNIFIDEKQQDSESGSVYSQDGASCKSIIESICTFAGWCAREYGNKLFFMPLAHNEGDAINMVYPSSPMQWASYDKLTNPSVESVVTKDISSLLWRGNGHSKSIKQGAKSVSLNASVKNKDLSMSIPECPLDNVKQTFNLIRDINDVEYYAHFRYYWSFLIVNKNRLFDNRFTFNMYTIEEENYHSDQTHQNFRGSAQACDFNTFWSGLVIGEENGVSYQRYWAQNAQGEETTSEWFTMPFGACMAKFYKNQTQTVASNPESGLLVAFPPRSLRANINLNVPDYLFKIASQIAYSFESGSSITLSGKSYLIWNNVNRSMSYGYATLNMMLAIGDDNNKQYWNGSAWQSSPAEFQVVVTSEWSVTINVASPISGKIYYAISHINDSSLRVYTSSRDGMYTECQNIFFKELSIKYNRPPGYTSNSRTENKYFDIISSVFNDEIELKTDIASNMNNQSAMSVLKIYSGGSFSQTDNATYNLSDDTTETRRPESDLIGRISKYYARNRRTLELECEHPTIEVEGVTTKVPLPMLQIDANTTDNPGYDGHKYLPLAEERNWQQDTSKLTCYETPDGDS